MTQQPLPQKNASFQDGLITLALKFKRFASDIGGTLVFTFAAITLLALWGLTEGNLITTWANFLRRWLGNGATPVVLVTGWAAAFALIRRRLNRDSGLPWGQIVSLEIAAFSWITLLAIFSGVDLDAAEQGLAGGRIGWGLAEFLGLFLPGFLRLILMTLILSMSILIGMGQWKKLIQWVQYKLDGTPIPEDDADPTAGRDGHLVQQSLPEEAPEAAPQTRRTPIKVSPEYRKKLSVRKDSDIQSPPPPRDEDMPPLDLLQPGKLLKPNERTINLTAGLIEQTLNEFGVPAKVIGVQVGPTVTQFAVAPGFVDKTGPEGERQQKVRVRQISGLRRDLALALSAERLRIEAPVPGKSYVGIEVPNAQSTTVRLRSVLQTTAFHRVNSGLAIALGLDVSGAPVVTDLAKMPHLLIAGTTGSGKSVCISALTTCLAMNNSPETLRLVMIDPKKVELVRFNGLPHLLGQVETDLERILGVLRWVVSEMDRRYRLLEEYRSRNIYTFNNKMRRRKNPPVKPLPNIVVLIDELADLMMSAADQTEPALVRLAQLARATGIHLVVATQRPSTDVVTGLIKANFPARLAFAVASGIDSRVILDGGGAESLLGSGDMLFLQPDAAGPLRAQGVFVSDKELDRVIEYWEKRYHDVEVDAPWEQMLATERVEADRDNLVNRAIELVRETQRVSASMLQRRLRVGYPRAARLVDELEDLGVIGPSQQGSRERDVLIDPDDD